MYKFIYEKYDVSNKKPYPNLLPAKCVSHSQLFQVFCKTKDNYVIVDRVINSNDKFLYPIEILGAIENLVYERALNEISQNIINLAKKGQITFIINYSHEPFRTSDGYGYRFFQELKKYVLTLGLSESMFIIYTGTYNLLTLEPKLKNIGFIFDYTDTLMLNTAEKLKELHEHSFFTLGYETTLIKEDEIDTPRSKYFICLNRNSERTFRFTLGCYFEYKKWWNDIYCSFLLNESPGTKHIFKTNDNNFDKNIYSVCEDFSKKIPLEFDTQNSKNKNSFESGRAYKKENGFLDSYIYVCTETVFEHGNIFLSEKSFHGIVALQPFILFAGKGHLKYMKDLGFKTFDDFINESYDEIENDGDRFVFLCNELERIHDLPLSEIHKWYVSIKKKLIYNREHLLKMSSRLPFIEELNRGLEL